MENGINININWYPGHMAKAKRLLTEQLKAVDAVIELVDARAPMSTRNPDLDKLITGKARLIVLNKADQADPTVTAGWIKYFEGKNISAMSFNSQSGKAKEALDRIALLTKPVTDRMKQRGINKTVRLMVIGIPNVGKSTFINKLKGRSVLKAQDRPGVTRSNTWTKVMPFLEIMDTPGLLPPKIEDKDMGIRLGWLGSVKDEITDSEQLSELLLCELDKLKPKEMRARFKIPEDMLLTGNGDYLSAVCRGRGFLLKGGELDTSRASGVVLDEFRGGKIARVSLEAYSGA